MPVEPQYMCLVVYDGTRTKSISRVFSKWSRSKVLVNINVILLSIYITGDKHFHISDLTLIGACKNITN